MQSDLGDCFSEIKKHLMQETKVCFIGTPCQVYGLKSYLRKEYDNLVTVDLVCHGTPSPKLWKKYLDEQKDKYHQEAFKFVQESWQLDNPGKKIADNTDFSLGEYGFGAALRYLNTSYAGTERQAVWNKFLEISPGLSPDDKRKTLKKLIDEQIVKDLSIPRFADEQAARQAFNQGEFNENDTILVNGIKMKLKEKSDD